MSIFVENDVIRLQVTENNVSLMQVFKSKENLGEVSPGSVFSKTFVFLKCTTHIATWCVVKEQEKLLWSLESILQTNDERMVSVGKHVSLSLCILYQVLAKDLLLIKYLHCEVFASFDWLLTLAFKSVFFYKIYNTKGPLS